MCITILAITVFEKFGEGGWLTLLVTAGVVARPNETALAIQRRLYWLGATMVVLPAKVT
jgi:hypothetical protein